MVAHPSGTRIPLNGEFFRDVARGASFVWTVQAHDFLRSLTGARCWAKIAFLPQRPRPYYAIWPVCRLARIKIVSDPAEADLLFFFHDTPSYEEALPDTDRPILNGRCRDVRKSHVSRLFAAVFGYPLGIDPTTHRGAAVEKSELNGVHDGKIIQCPIEAPRPGMVYQRLIENTVDGMEFTDIRTPVVGGRAPVVYLKRRTPDKRFSNSNHQVDLGRTDDYLSADEQSKVGEFCEAIGLDFGGLDILRDRADGRIYIVDVNKTDMGPPTALAGADKIRAMNRIADAFRAFVAAKLQK
ncbi:MAG: hypothetical protein Tsb0010_03900 [Parvularculaceae bacterium]